MTLDKITLNHLSPNHIRHIVCWQSIPDIVGMILGKRVCGIFPSHVFQGEVATRMPEFVVGQVVYFAADYDPHIILGVVFGDFGH